MNVQGATSWHRISSVCLQPMRSHKSARRVEMCRRTRAAAGSLQSDSAPVSKAPAGQICSRGAASSARCQRCSLRHALTLPLHGAGNVTESNTTTYTVQGFMPVAAPQGLLVFDVVATATDNLDAITTLGVTSGASPPFLIM